MSEQRNYMAEVQALIDQKWKENPEEMKRVMEEIKAKEKKEKNAKVETPKVKPSKQVSFDPQLTQELIKELYKPFDRVDISKVQDLIERGADVEAKTNDGHTPLHWASRNNRIEIAKLLLDRGADVKAKDDWGKTPLHRASWNNHIEIAELLLNRGANLEAKDNDGWTPLDLAQSDEMEELLQKYMK